MKAAAMEHIPKKERYKPKENISQKAKDIIKKRTEAWQSYNRNEATRLAKELRAQMKRDRRQRELDMVSKDLDVRDKWLGIRLLKKGYTPIPYTLKDETGRRYKIGNKAEEAAKFLETRIWGNTRREGIPDTSTEQILTHDLGIDTTPITTREL
jgi:hypothetical protein